MSPAEYKNIQLVGAYGHFGDINNYSDTYNINIGKDPIALPPTPQSHAIGEAVKSAVQNNQLALSSVVTLQAHPIPNPYKRCSCGERSQSVSTHRILGRMIVSKIYKCKRCSKISKIFIRTPIWLSRFNIYVLGSPERTLKAQRKVPWGTEENILKHCLTGDLEAVKELLSSRQATLYDIDPNHGRTPLHYAVQKGHIEMCRVLLCMGADPEFEDYNGTTAEWKAWEHILSRRGSPSNCEELRHLFPNFDQDDQSFSHLHSVIVGERPIDVSAVLDQAQYKAQINSRDIRGRTALHWACDRGDVAGVSALIDAGANLNIKDSLGSTPLMFAASCGNMSILGKLLSSGARVNIYASRGDSPLHFASRHQREVAAVRALVEAGSDLNHKNKMGNTPLVGAAIMNRVEIGKYLVEAGADIETCGMYGDTPLFETIYHNSHEFMTMLLEKKVQTENSNRSGNTILHAVAFEGDVETVKLLCRSGVRLPNARAKNSAGEDAREMFSKRLKSPAGFGSHLQTLLSQADGK